MKANPKKIAKSVGLRYVQDNISGIRRRRRGKGFSFFDPQGNLIQDPAKRQQLKALPIPPSWQDVWICPYSNGHLIATGRDQKNRKQYRYHPDWQTLRNEAKFDRLIAFGQALPKIRKQVQADLTQTKFTRTKVLALVVKLLDETAIRIGNDEYAEANGSYGLSTLRNKHVKVLAQTIQFQFSGKSGVEHNIQLKDAYLAKAIKQCKEIPGYSLFQYFDHDGNRQSVDSGEVNEYLQSLSDEDFTTKEFRTWIGTTVATDTLIQSPEPSSKQEVKENIVQAVKLAAQTLGNRVATCRNYYIHPGILRTYEEGQLLTLAQNIKVNTNSLLSDYEQITLSVLKQIA